MPAAIQDVILHAAVRRPGAVDVWYYRRNENIQPMRRSFQIVATGQPIPTMLARHHGTAISPDGMLVWHVLENACPHQDVAEVPEMKDPPDRVPGICRDCGTHLIGDGQGVWAPR